MLFSVVVLNMTSESNDSILSFLRSEICSVSSDPLASANNGSNRKSLCISNPAGCSVDLYSNDRLTVVPSIFDDASSIISKNNDVSCVSASSSPLHHNNNNDDDDDDDDEDYIDDYPSKKSSGDRVVRRVRKNATTTRATTDTTTDDNLLAATPSIVEEFERMVAELIDLDGAAANHHDQSHQSDDTTAIEPISLEAAEAVDTAVAELALKKRTVVVNKFSPVVEVTDDHDHDDERCRSPHRKPTTTRSSSSSITRIKKRKVVAVDVERNDNCDGGEQMSRKKRRSTVANKLKKNCVAIGNDVASSAGLADDPVQPYDAVRCSTTNLYSPLVARYGFQYNLEAVFSVFVAMINQRTEIEILVVRDRIGVESYWYPAKQLVQACGFKNIYTTMKYRLPADTLRTYRDLQQTYGFNFTINASRLFVNDDGLNFIFYGTRRGKMDSSSIESVRGWLLQFQRTRRYVVGQLIKQLVDEYIRWIRPPSQSSLSFATATEVETFPSTSPVVSFDVSAATKNIVTTNACAEAIATTVFSTTAVTTTAATTATTTIATSTATTAITTTSTIDV